MHGELHRVNNTPSYSSDWAWSRIGAAKHAVGMLKVNRERKRKLGEDVRNHVGGRAPNDGDRALPDKVTNVMVIDVDAFRLRGGHIVDSEGDAALGVFVGDSRAFDRASKSREKEHSFLG